MFASRLPDRAPRRALLAAALAAALVPGLAVAPPARAEDAPPPAAVSQSALEPAIGALEEAVGRGMSALGVPGAAVGVVAGGKLVFAKGYGVASAGGRPVGPDTVFQIGSTTKAFLATTLAMMVAEKKFSWESRVSALYPAFDLRDPWVTREFRVFDLLAQRSGLRPYTNDTLAVLGYDADAMIGSLRFAEPVSSFRSAFAYLNIPHLVAGRIVAAAAGKDSWQSVLQARILDPLGMTATTTTAAAIEAAPDHALGHRWTSGGAVEVPFDPRFPYALGPAGDMNSTVTDMSKWLTTLLAGGRFGDTQIVDPAALGYTFMPEVAINDQMSYAMGWIVNDTPGGRVIWHNGGTMGFNAHVGFLPHLGVGVVVLSNLENRGFADGVAYAFYSRLLGIPDDDVLGRGLAKAKSDEAADAATYARPADARPPRALAALAGRYDSQVFGPMTVRADGGALAATLEKTGAELVLAPFDGDVFTVALAPKGDFAATVAAIGDVPLGFAQWQIDGDGKLGFIDVTIEHQPYRFRRLGD